MIDNILQELRKPFHPSDVTWKPQATTKDNTKAMAAAYADMRAYQNRLDEVCGMDWSVTYTPWGDRIVCHITISGVTRSSSGEGDSQSERSEIAGTAAEAQAFKRACAMFGLGRYLYNFPTTWVEYDASKKQFADAGRKKLDNIVIEHYNRHTKESAPINKAPGGNGHDTQAASAAADKDATIDALITGWTSPADAKRWAVDGKYTANEFSADNSFKTIVKNDFGGTCTTANLKDIFRAYATHYFNKQAQLTRETA